MLKATMSTKHDINIKNFSKLSSFLKRQSAGHKSKKSKVFTAQDVKTFINEAPDDIYLAVKIYVSTQTRVTQSVQMPLFGRFKFSLDLSSNKNLTEIAENASPIGGAYKSYREDFFGKGTFDEPPKKISPSMVKLPPSLQPDPTSQDVNGLSKSTGDLTQNQHTLKLPPNLRKSTPEVSTDPKGGNTSNNRNSVDVRQLKNKSNKNADTKNSDKKKRPEGKKRENKTADNSQINVDKKKQVEDKKREKLEAQQRAKQEKLDKAREKAERQEQAKQEKIRKSKEKADVAKAKKEKKTKEKTPKPKKKDKTAKPNNPLAQTNIVPTNPLAKGSSANAASNYNSNTLDSSISKTSGPPPYNSINSPEPSPIVKNERDDTGNTSFGKPIDEGDSWDLVAQHRAQMSRTPAATASNKVTVRLTNPNEPVIGRKSLYV